MPTSVHHGAGWLGRGVTGVTGDRISAGAGGTGDLPATGGATTGACRELDVLPAPPYHLHWDDRSGWYAMPAAPFGRGRMAMPANASVPDAREPPREQVLRVNEQVTRDPEIRGG